MSKNYPKPCPVDAVGGAGAFACQPPARSSVGGRKRRHQALDTPTTGALPRLICTSIGLPSSSLIFDSDILPTPCKGIAPCDLGSIQGLKKPLLGCTAMLLEMRVSGPGEPLTGPVFTGGEILSAPVPYKYR